MGHPEDPKHKASESAAPAAPRLDSGSAPSRADRQRRAQDGGVGFDDDAAFALVAQDDARARPLFQQGMLRADPAARRLAAAGAVLAVAAEFADFRGLPQALSALDVVTRAAWPACARPQDQARVDAALLAVPLLDAAVATDDATVSSAAERLSAALAGPLPVTPDERMLLWKLLYDYRAQRMDTDALQRIAAHAQDFLRAGSVSPRWQALWWLLVARNHDYFGNADAAEQALARAGTLAELHGLAAIRYELLCVEMTAALKAEAGARAEAIAREIDRLLPEVRAGRLPAGLRAQAWWRLWRGEPATALHCLERLLAICEDVQVPPRDRGAYQVLRAYALLALQRHADGLATLQAQRAHQCGDQGALLEVLIDLVDGLGALHAGRPDAQVRLCAAVRRCAAMQFHRFLLPLPALAAQVAQVALAADVETEFIAGVVRSRRLVPDDPAREDWPWRLQVRVLGPLQVLRDGQPLPLAAKRPKKPLELLALLAAQGRRALPMDAAIDALWPDSEADDPKAALEVALARLRKLLGVPGAVQMVDGGMQLDARVVWTDAAAFEILEQCGLNPPAGAHATRDAAANAAPRAMALYRGALLAGDKLGSAPWKLLRQQYALRHMRLVSGRGAELEQRGQWRDALAVYEQGLEHDPLSEPLYRALMRAQLQLGERAEVLRSYRRCHDVLAAALGTQPAHETRALREQAER